MATKPKVNISPSQGWSVSPKNPQERLPRYGKQMQAIPVMPGAKPAGKAPAMATKQTDAAAKAIKSENKLNVFGAAGTTGKEKASSIVAKPAPKVARYGTKK